MIGLLLLILAVAMTTAVCIAACCRSSQIEQEVFNI